MTSSPSRTTSAVLAVTLAVAACSGTSRPAPQTSAQPATTGQSDRPAVARARADSLRHPYTQADVDFMSHMIGHHAQAIMMADLAPTHGARPEVRRLAERIINAQEDEIATMQRWLRNRRLTVPEARPTGVKMMMNGVEHEMLMPGMLTETQMNELNQARGAEFDRLFLTYMIQHHKGAVAMVKDLFDTPGAAQDETVFKFASDVSVDQSTEIARMERMLADPSAGAGSP